MTLTVTVECPNCEYVTVVFPSAEDAETDTPTNTTCPGGCIVLDFQQRHVTNMAPPYLVEGPSSPVQRLRSPLLLVRRGSRRMDLVYAERRVTVDG